MSAPALRAESLGKDYVIGRPGRGVVTFGETLQRVVTAPVRAVRRQPSPTPRGRTVTVLHDVSFEIAPGEAVGFIGHNGAGKSTLLKVLSRITTPTRGRAEVRGRLGALLEVGTGFHPELTGRENVYLNGAVLGMGRSETARRFDEIVAFADVEQFLDTPVKRYSSGMVVRLAFAVAAHLEPDILVVDEVLAVGDAGFQRRCLERMAEVAQDGRTVLLVSHNMSVVQSLCRRAVVLEHGRVVDDGPVERAITTYLRGLEDLQHVDLRERTDRTGTGDVRLVAVAVEGGEHGAVVSGGPTTITVDVDRPVGQTSCDVRVVDELGAVITTLSSAFVAPDDAATEGPCRFVCQVDELLLVAGRYRLDVSVRTGKTLQDELQAAAVVDVVPAAVRGRAVSHKQQGRVLLPHRWRTPR